MLCQHGSNNVINTPLSPSNSKRTKGHIRVFIVMTKHEKAKQVLEAFIESYSMEGACGAFFVDPKMDVHSNYNIHVVFNIDWIKNQEAAV